MNHSLVLSMCVLVLQCLMPRALCASGTSLLDKVSTLQGTDSNIGYSHGGTLPLVGSPWAMTQFAPQTFSGTREWFEGGGWWFQYDAKHINGFRATRQPSPWMGDYGFFSIMPVVGDVGFKQGDRESEYDVDASTFRPDYFKAELKRYNILAEMTASERCAVMRFTYRKGDVGKLMIDPSRVSHIEIDGDTIRGFSTANNGGVPKNWKAYFVVRLDRPVTKTGTYNADYSVNTDAKQIDGDRVGAFVEFSLPEGQRAVNVQIATSYISYEQAGLNLQRETEGGFDATRERTAQEWERNLSKIQIKGGTEEQQRTFYSCLYRAQTFPHKLHELDSAGKPIHFSVYNGKVENGVAYGDIGFWDVYRSNFPFWSIAYPDQLREMLNGFVQSYKEDGWFPQWPSPGHRSGMVGTHIDAVFADAVAKKLGGFDVEAAYQGIRKNAFEKSPGGPVGRGDLEDYLQLGYVPTGKDAGYTVSATLDYAYDDWCVAQVARSLGKQQDYDELMRRSKNYTKLWDAQTSSFRPKRRDGEWFGPFDEFAWSRGYVEGGPWQCTWAVQHDVAGLSELMGGNDKMAQKLDRMMGLPPVFHVGDYGQVIHEMAEMANVPFGQYAHSNQPVHHVLYLYSAIGQPWKTQYWTRRVCTELYSATPQGFAGDEDNGEMSSWYLLSSMGLYQLCVGDPNYTLTSSLFDEVRIELPNQQSFTIRAKNNGPRNIYVQSASLNGKPLNGVTISHEQLMNGGELVLEMGARVPTDPDLKKKTD